MRTPLASTGCFFLVFSVILQLLWVTPSVESFVVHDVHPFLSLKATAMKTKIRSSCHLQKHKKKHHRMRSIHTSAALNFVNFSINNNASPTFCLTALLLLSTFGLTLERRTVVGKALSAPLATMALALIVANLGIVPFESPVYKAVNQFLVPMAVPLLLLDSDLRRIGRETGSLLACFAVGALATVVGTLASFFFIPLQALGRDTGWKIACALAARHIGGAINFVAVAETLHIPGSAVSAAIAADNVVVALYFALLFALAKTDADKKDTNIQNRNENSNAVGDVIKIESELDYSLVKTNEPRQQEQDITLSTLATAVSVAATLVTVGEWGTRLLLSPGTSALPLTSALTVLLATIFPNFFVKIRAAGTAVGILLIQLFFACSGAAGSLRRVLEQAPALLAFSVLQLAVHLAFLLVLGRGIFRLDVNELYLASNANVGGPTTAAAMAQAKGWKDRVLPALLVGILGYATATAIALVIVQPALVRLLPPAV